MAIDVELPDGRTIEVATDDPQAAARAAKEFLAKENTTPTTQAPEKARDVYESIRAPNDIEQLRMQGPLGALAAEATLASDATVEGFTGLADMALKGAAGLSDIFSMPVREAANFVLPDDRQIPSASQLTPDLTTFKRETVDPALRKIGIADVKADELAPADRFKYRFAEAAIPTALTLGAGTAGMGDDVARAGGSLADDIMAGITKQIRDKPVRASAEEIAASAGGAAGLTLAEEADLPPWAQVAASLGGSLAAAPIASAPFSIADNFAGKADDAKYARMLQDAAINPKQAASNIADDLDAARSLDTKGPSAFLSSDDAGLIGMERALRSKPDYGPKATEFERRLRSDLGDRVSDIRPKGADTRAPQRLAASQRAAMLDDIATRQGAAEKAAGAADDALATTSAPVAAAKGGERAASRALDDVVVEDTLKPRRAARNAKYAQIDPDRSVEVDTTSIRAALDDVRASGGTNFQGRITPEKELGELDALINGDQPVTYADLQDARSAIAASIRDASVGVDGSKAPPYVDKLRTLKRSIDDLDPNALSDPSAAKAAADAKAFHETEFAPFFGRGAGKELRKAIDNDDFTRSGRSAPEDTAAKFFIKTGRRSEDAAKDLREILRVAPDEEAGIDAVRNYLFASAARTVDEKGNINPARMRAWLDKHQGPLKAFPEIDAELRGVLKGAVNASDAGKAAKADLARIAKEAQTSTTEFNKSVAGVLLDNEPGNAVRKIMAAKDRQKAMADAMKLVGKDRQAKAGFKAAVADWLKESVTGTAGGKTADNTDPVTVGAMTKMLRQNRNTLRAVFDEDEIKALEDVNKLLRSAARVDNVRGSNNSVTQELKMAEIDTTLLESALKAKYGVLKGGGIMRIVGRLIGRGQELTGTDTNARAAQLREALLDISTDPEKAIHLLNYQDTPAWEKKFSRLFLVAEAADED